MLKIKVSTLKPGVKIGKDIFSYDGQLLISKGTTISEDHLNTFERRQITELFIMEDTPRLRSLINFSDAYLNALENIRTIMLESRIKEEIKYNDVIETVKMLKEQAFDETDLLKQMRLMKGKDDYLYTHSINVCLLCILIGRWLKCDQQTISDLGIAGLLHDVGKSFIPSEVLDRSDKLTDEEFLIVKNHCEYGYNIVKNVFSDTIAQAVFMHHERLDGSGYPRGLKDNQINFLASVIAVADMYDAITSDRNYSSKNSPYFAAEVLWDESFGKLNPKIAKIFYDKITNFYVGNEVMLSNNTRGIVVYVDPTLPTRPIVMVGDEFYNLALDRSIIILDVID